jgi:NhaP-type Na+/H+ and K+/H+ antiporter
MIADTLRSITLPLYDTLAQLPAAVGIGLWVAPVVVAMISRQWIALLASAAFCLAGLAFYTSADTLAASAGLLSGYMAAFAAALWGLQRQRQSSELNAINGLLTQMQMEMRTFLDALDRRSTVADRALRDASQIVPAPPLTGPSHNGHDGGDHAR